VRRREFIALVGGAAAWPLAARAQQPRRVGFLSTGVESDPQNQADVQALRQGLQRLGWTEGGNLHVEYRWAAGDAERARTYARELAGIKPDVLVATVASALAPLQKATDTIPIVFVQVGDPLGAGFVNNLAHPGGNITGFSSAEFSVAGKWLELLKQIAPTVARGAVIYDPTNPAAAGYLRAIETGAAGFGVTLSSVAVRNLAEVEGAIENLVDKPNGGLLVIPGATTQIHRDLIIGLTGRHQVPAVYPYRFYVESGGLASYGIDRHDLYRRAASYIDRILRGEAPGDLPVQQATKFELVINLKTARALGLDIPVALLARTDEVIE
jgi:putative tryptophan/tyrosine transport system substrate-binding protein